MTINYVGENLELGKWGHISVLISFVFAILSAVSYYFSVEGKENEKEMWRKIGRYSFFTHAAGIALIVGILFYMLFNHHFEYLYVWKHSSKEMPLRYILSCFWEGQEGSFLLWTIWHVVLGGVLLFTAKKWEAPVMSIVSAVQVFLVSMLLGIHIPSGPYIGLMILILGAFIGSYNRVIDFWFNNSQRDQIMLQKIDEEDDPPGTPKSDTLLVSPAQDAVEVKLPDPVPTDVKKEEEK